VSEGRIAIESQKLCASMRPLLLEVLFYGTIPRAFELDWRRSS
jgi:hypothetical protein